MALDGLRRLVRSIKGGRPDADFQWRTTAILDQGTLGEACLALDGLGRGMALWENDGGLWTMPVGSGATPALMLYPMGEGTSPRLRLNPSGRGIALWLATEEGGHRIRGRNLGGAEEDGHLIFQTAGRVHHLQSVVDRRGNALVVWLHERGGCFEVLAQSFDVRAHSWELEPRVLSTPGTLPMEPRIAMNNREQAMVLWEVQERSFEGLMASHYWPADRIWSDRPVPVVTHATCQHQVVMDDLGNALAIWINTGRDGLSCLEASSYDAQLGEWREPMILANAPSVSPPRLVMSGNGEALAAWCQGDTHETSRLFGRSFAGGQWERETVCLDGGQGPVLDFAIALDPEAKAGLLSVHNGPEGSWVSARLRQRAWSTPKRLASVSRLPCTAPRLGFSAQGVSALWIQGEGQEKSLILTETR